MQSYLKQPHLLLIYSVIVISQPFQSPSPKVANIRHVTVIGVDGMSPDGLRNALTPNMDSLMKHGSHTLQAPAVLPANSSVLLTLEDMLETNFL